MRVERNSQLYREGHSHHWWQGARIRYYRLRDRLRCCLCATLVRIIFTHHLSLEEVRTYTSLVKSLVATGYPWRKTGLTWVFFRYVYTSMLLRDNLISQHWHHVQFPNIYLSVASPSFPNFFFIGGPTGNWAQGSVLATVSQLYNTSFLETLYLERRLSGFSPNPSLLSPRSQLLSKFTASSALCKTQSEGSHAARNSSRIRPSMCTEDLHREHPQPQPLPSTYKCLPGARRYLAPHEIRMGRVL